jgi:hypothetical protein
VKQIYEYIYSFVTIGLVLAGIGGVAYNAFREGGWLGILFSKFVDVQLENPLIAIPVTIGAVVIGKMWRDNQIAKGRTSKLPDVFVYVIMAAGAFYLWRFFSTGSF